MTRILFLASFFVSALAAPWPLTVLLGIVLVAAWRARFSVVLGGALMDAAFGIAVPALGGFAFVYTALFAVVACTDIIVRARMMD